MTISFNSVAILDALIAHNLELSIMLILVGYSCVSKKLSTNCLLAALLIYQTYPPKSMPLAVVKASWAVVLYLTYIRIAELEKKLDFIERSIHKIKRSNSQEIPEGRILRMAEELSRFRMGVNIVKNEVECKKRSVLQNIIRFLY